MYRVSGASTSLVSGSPEISSACNGNTDMLFEASLRARLPVVLFELLAPSVEFTFRVPPSTCSLALQPHVARVLQHWAALAEGAASQGFLPRPHTAILEDIKVTPRAQGPDP